MKIAIIGRTEILYDSALFLKESGHDIVFILTSKEAVEYKRTANDFRMLAESLSVPFAQGSDIMTFSDELSDCCPDIGISMNYTGILPQSIVDIFPYGVLNSHGGDLPRYRGNACQAWAIINGEEKIGLCVHKMIGGEIDSGDIIARDYFEISENTKVGQIWDWMNFRTPKLFLNAINHLLENPEFTLDRQSKYDEDILYCYPRKPEDGRIDWGKSGIEVLRLINASNKPYAGAFCEFEGINMIVWDAELVTDKEVFCAVPGQVTNIGEGFIEVACGNGKLRLVQIEIDGSVMSPDSIIKSIRKRLS